MSLNFRRSRITRTGWALPIASVLFLVKVGSSRASSEETSAVTETRGAGSVSDPAPNVIEQVRFESDGTWFRMILPTEAPWSHWTLEDPPRIVVDLGHSTSRLANAPGLFQTRLNRGPVQVFRTSQYQDDPLDRRVRLTLELTRAVAYQAHRVGNEIEILVPDPIPREPREFLLDRDGLRTPGSAADPEAVRTLREALAGLVGHDHVEQIDRSADDGGAAERSRRPAEASRPILDPIAPIPDDEVETTRVEPRSSGDVKPTKVGPHSHEDIEPQHAEPIDEWAKNEIISNPSSLEGFADRSARDEARGVDAAADAHAQDALGADSHDSDSPNLSSSGRPLTPEAAEAREKSAERLLREAVRHWVRSEEKAATDKLERARRYYGATDAGGQAGLLLRELLIVEGRDLEADRLDGVAEAPDTARIPGAAVVQLVERLLEKGDLLEADRIFRSWGPAYGDDAGLEAFSWRLGEAFYRAGRSERAAELLESATPGDSLEARSLLLLARIREERGETDKALEIYARSSTLPTSPWQQRGLARTADLMFQSGNVAEALDVYLAVIEGRPPSDEAVWAVYQSANCYLLLGDSSRARARYQIVVDRWPASYWAPFAQERLEALAWQEQLTQDEAPGTH